MDRRHAKRFALFLNGHWLLNADTYGLDDDLSKSLSHDDVQRIEAAQKELACELIRRSGFSSLEQAHASIAAGKGGDA